MTNPLPGGPGFDFRVYSHRVVGFTMPKEPPHPLLWTATSSGPLPFEMSGLGDPARSLSSRQHSSPGHSGACKPPHHDKVAALEAAFTYHPFIWCYIILFTEKVQINKEQIQNPPLDRVNCILHFTVTHIFWKSSTTGQTCTSPEHCSIKNCST
jgi:hypothetical protein